MKNLLCIVCLLAFICGQLFAQAQITIDHTDMPQPGEMQRHSIADTVMSVDYTSTGANHIWDFSDLTPMFQRSDSFLSRSDLPFVLQFTAPSDVSVITYLDTPGGGDTTSPAGGILDGGFDLFRTSPAAFESLGQVAVLGGLLPTFLEKDPIDTVYRFPMNFADQDSSESVGELALSIPGIGDIYVRQERKRINEVDGWGSITTPFGTFDALRIRSHITGYDSIAFDSINIGFPAIPSVEYKWLAKEEHVPILQINTTAFGGLEIVTQVTYRDSLREGVPTLSIEDDLEPLEATVYPNPSDGVIHVDFEDLSSPQASLQLIDMQGRLVQHRTLQGYQHRVTLEGLAAGTYLLRIHTDKKAYMGKVVVR